MKTLNLTILLSVLLALVSCSGSPSSNVKKVKRSLLPTSTGQPYEVMVVADPQTYKGEAGQALFDILNNDVPGLPQPEPLMKVSKVAPEHFTGFLKMMRNVVMLEIGQQYTVAQMRFVRNVWSNAQMVVYLQAPSVMAMAQFLAQPLQGEKLIDAFYTSELSRTATMYMDMYSRDQSRKVEDMLGVSIRIPEYLTSSKSGKDFIWASDNSAAPMNICVYSIPYTRSDAFTLERIIHERDSVMKANIPGSLEGSYMATSKTVMPSFKEMTLNGKYCAEVRGLWKMENDMMGGPFVSHTRLDEVNNRVITVEAFVFAPARPKRNMIKRMEAALYTLQLPGEQMLPEVIIGGGEQNEELQQDIALHKSE